MKVAPLITVALILCIAFLGPIQAKKKSKPKFCIGQNGNQYAVGNGYIDTEGEVCIRYRCVKKKKKVVMKENNCIDGEWSDWSSWSGCTATCGNATRTKERTCSNPPPSKGGNQCSGPDEKIEECSLPKCRPDMNVRVDSLELNFQSLNDSVQTIQTTMLSVLELMTTMQAAANKQGTCLSDLSSSECPASAAGKVGVVDGIAANTANITTNTAGLAYSKAGIATNQAGVATNKAGVATNKAGVATNQAGVATNKAGVATNQAGVATNKAGVATNKAGVATNQAGFTTIKAGIATNQADIATNQAAIATTKDDITFNNDNCSSIQATATKLGTCMMDLASSDCPDSAPGKVGVVDGINFNKAGMNTNKAGVMSTKADINTNKAGINTNKAGINTSNAAINTNQADINANKVGINTNTAGIASSKVDINTNKAGIMTSKADINTNKAGINTNKAGINTNKAAINTNSAAINTNKAGLISTQADINTNKAGINTNKAGIATSKADINTNMAGINTNKAGINSNKDGINTNKADVNTNKARMAKHHPGCGDILHEDPVGGPSGWTLCFIDETDTSYHSTACSELLQGIPIYGTAAKLLAAGGNFGCWHGKSGSQEGAYYANNNMVSQSCRDNVQHNNQLGVWPASTTTFGVCIRYP